MPMYNLLEHSDNYSKKPGSFWQQYRDKPALNDAGDNFPGKNASIKFKQKITGSTLQQLLQFQLYQPKIAKNYCIN